MKRNLVNAAIVGLLLCCAGTIWAQGTAEKHVTISTRWRGEYSEDANTQGPAPGGRGHANPIAGQRH